MSPTALSGRWLVVALMALATLCGCSSSGSCPNDLPASCVTPAPSYATTVLPILNANCVSCHAPGGVDASRPLETYQEVYDMRSAVLDQVYSCKMPTAGSPQPSTTERQDLLMWLVCGAPQN
jgi:hypothetical protein